MAYSIRQENQYTIKDKTRREAPLDVILPSSVDEIPKYVSAVSDKKILKFGYCCEPSAHIYPIFIKVNGIYRLIYVNKSGMYEMQQEIYGDIEIEELQTSKVIVTEILVPDGIDFTLEWVTF